MNFATLYMQTATTFLFFYVFLKKSACNGVYVLIEYHCKDKTTQNKEVQTMRKYNRFGMTGNKFRKIFKPMRSHKMPKCIRTKFYWFLYDEVFNCYE